MLEKATQRLASMYGMTQVDTAKEEQLYVFSAVKHVPKAAARVGVALNSSVQVRSTTNCMIGSAQQESTCMALVHQAEKLHCCYHNAPEVGSLAGLLAWC